MTGDADLLVARNAIPEGAVGVARRLHMPPSEIGRIAQRAGVRQLVLSHFMNRTLGREAQTRAVIRRAYVGPLFFARDLDRFPLMLDGWRRPGVTSLRDPVRNVGCP